MRDSVIVGLTKRRVPDVAFLDDGSQTTTTVQVPLPPTTPAQPLQLPAPPDLSGLSVPSPAPLDPAYAQYVQQAISGTLPVPVALENDITRQQGILTQALAKSMGPGWQTSAPGVSAMAEFNSRANGLRDAARHGSSATTSALLQGILQQNQFSNQAQLAMFQAQVQTSLEVYQAELEAALFANKQANVSGGTQTTQTTSGGGGGGYGKILGGIAGMGAAAILGAANKPWWMGGGKTNPNDPNAAGQSGGTAGGLFGTSATPIGSLNTVDPWAYSLPSLAPSGQLYSPPSYNIGDFSSYWQSLMQPSYPTFNLSGPSFPSLSLYDLSSMGGGAGGWGTGGYNLGFDPTLNLGSYGLGSYNLPSFSSLGVSPQPSLNWSDYLGYV